MTFEEWLRTVCFQKPTPEAHDLAKSAWEASARSSGVITFEEWFTDDDHDFFNYPEEAMKAAWDASMVGSMSDEEKIRIRDSIIQEICESLKADPDNDQTISIRYEYLYRIISEHLDLEESH